MNSDAKNAERAWRRHDSPGQTVAARTGDRGRAYTLTIDPQRLKLVEKGRRKGIELAWTDLVNGDAALATALQASLAQLR